ncbi:MAG: hypothetical protein QOF36_1064 [Microbacteriaceae bacterium]|nr:hypothetical protein [Microbacteriaceae bacterium]
MSATNRIAAAAGLVAAALMFTGCSGLGQSGPARSPNPSAAPTAPEAVVDTPQQRFDLACEDLISYEQAKTVLGSAIRPAAWQTDGTSIELAGYALEQSGGMACMWSDGMPITQDTGYQQAGARVAIRPESQERWDQYAIQYGAVTGPGAAYGSSALGPRCVGGAEDGGYTDCMLEFSDHGYWTDVTLYQVGSAKGLTEDAAQALAKPIFDRIAAAVEDLPAPAPALEPRNAKRLPGACNDVANIDNVRSALATRFELAYGIPGGGSIPGTIMTDDAAGICVLGLAESDQSIGWFVWLEGGAVAYDRAVVPAVARGSARSVTLAGMREGDAAAIECTDSQQDCVLDLRSSGNWIRTRILAHGHIDNGVPVVISAADVATARANITKLGTLLLKS